MIINLLINDNIQPVPDTLRNTGSANSVINIFPIFSWALVCAKRRLYVSVFSARNLKLNVWLAIRTSWLAQPKAKYTCVF
jgi:hypothetical protein